MDLRTIFDQMGKSVPLEIGFDRRLAGSRDGVTLTSPIPQQVIIVEPIPPMRTEPSLSDVLTRSSIPTLSGMGVLPSLRTTQVISEDDSHTRSSDPDDIEEKDESVFRTEKMNEALYAMLTSDPIAISCACDTWEFYPMANPTQGEIVWKVDQKFVHRGEDGQFETIDEYKIAYSRWSPKDGFSGAPKLLLLHDALDSRRSWWCAQKLLSPFLDTVSVDLLGSGDSTKPLGIEPDNADDTGDFPWSFTMHAKYLVGIARIIWPGEQFFVAGVGWGAQIAATMASISSFVSGMVMINPPGFGLEIHPELHYTDIYDLAKIVTDKDFEYAPISYIGRVRNCILASLSSSDLGHSGRDNASTSIIRLILEQYKDIDRRRILVDQLVAISSLKHQELPQTKENPNGLQIENIICPCRIVTGGNDIIYPAEHRNLYPAVYYASTVTTVHMPSLGHLAHIESPKAIAETILDSIRSQTGFSELKDAFIGFEGSTQGNERSIVNALREVYQF